MTAYTHRDIAIRAYTAGVLRARAAYYGERKGVDQGRMCATCGKRKATGRKRECNPCIYQRKKSAA